MTLFNQDFPNLSQVARLYQASHHPKEFHWPLTSLIPLRQTIMASSPPPLPLRKTYSGSLHVSNLPRTLISPSSTPPLFHCLQFFNKPRRPLGSPSGHRAFRLDRVLWLSLYHRQETASTVTPAILTKKIPQSIQESKQAKGYPVCFIAKWGFEPTSALSSPTS